MKVYFMKHGRSNIYKIGFTRNINQRVKGIQMHNPVKISVVYSINADCSYEKFLHRTYDKYRVRGEWFRLDKELLAEATSRKIRQRYLRQTHDKRMKQKRRSRRLQEMRFERYRYRYVDRAPF